MGIRFRTVKDAMARMSAYAQAWTEPTPRCYLILLQWCKLPLTSLSRSVATRSAAFPWDGRVSLWLSESLALPSVIARRSKVAAVNAFTVTRSVDDTGSVVKATRVWLTKRAPRRWWRWLRESIGTCTCAMDHQSVKCKQCQQVDLMLIFTEAHLEQKLRQDRRWVELWGKINICSGSKLSKFPDYSRSKIGTSSFHVLMRAILLLSYKKSRSATSKRVYCLTQVKFATRSIYHHRKSLPDSERPNGQIWMPVFKAKNSQHRSSLILSQWSTSSNHSLGSDRASSHGRQHSPGLVGSTCGFPKVLHSPAPKQAGAVSPHCTHSQSHVPLMMRGPLAKQPSPGSHCGHSLCGKRPLSPARTKKGKSVSQVQSMPASGLDTDFQRSSLGTKTTTRPQMSWLVVKNHHLLWIKTVQVSGILAK